MVAEIEPKKKAAPKSSRAVRQAHLARVATLYCQGVPNGQIAELTDRTASAITYDVNALLKKWQAEQIEGIDKIKVEQLAKIDVVEADAWDAWKQSRGVHVKRTRKTKSTELTQAARDDAEEFRIKIPVEEVERTRQKEKLAGDPRFLAIVLDCIKRRCDILGLDAPKQIDGDITYHFDFSQVPDDTLSDFSGRLEGLLGK